MMKSKGKDYSCEVEEGPGAARPLPLPLFDQTSPANHFTLRLLAASIAYYEEFARFSPDIEYISSSPPATSLAS